MATIEGVINTMVTPFTKDGDVDYATFEKQVLFLLANGAKTLAYPMHYGESLNLRENEYKECAKIVVETANGKVPTFINVSSAGTDITCDYAKHAAQIGADGIVVLTPYYWKPEPADVIDHVARAAKANGGMVILYKSPGATGTNVGPAFLRRMIEAVPKLVGVKDATFNMVDFTRACQVAREIPTLGIYTGVEYLLTSVPVGGSGSFSAAGEVAPRLTHGLYDACVSGDISLARKLQFDMHELLESIQQCYPGGIKHAMALMGRPVGDVRSPIRRLSPDEIKGIEKVLRSLKSFEREPKGWA
jgi:4-hydroxy-tetrahydrodipicolinate synthase